MKDSKIKIVYAAIIVCIGVMVFGVVMLIGGMRNTGDSSSNNNAQSNQQDDGNEQDQPAGSDTYIVDDVVSGAVRKQTLRIKGIPTIVYYQETMEDKPILIFQHGLEGTKEGVELFASAIASNDFVVVTTDAYGHGESKNSEALTVFEIAEKTATNLDIVLDYFITTNKVDQNRIGLMGFSLGAFTSLYHSVHSSYPVKMVISVCGNPDFTKMIGQDVTYAVYKNGQLEYQKTKDEKIEAFINEMNPYDLLLDSNFNLLLFCGEKDEVVPYEGNVQFIEDSKDTANADNVSIVIKENQGHEITEDDMWELLYYIKVNL